jgi:hypothetical protein
MIHIALKTIVAGLGFEPRYTDPKSVVLPLDDPALWILQQLTLQNLEINFKSLFAEL